MTETLNMFTLGVGGDSADKGGRRERSHKWRIKIPKEARKDRCGRIILRDKGTLCPQKLAEIQKEYHQFCVWGKKSKEFYQKAFLFFLKLKSRNEAD